MNWSQACLEAHMGLGACSSAVVCVALVERDVDPTSKYLVHDKITNARS
ncbi:MAG: hypothetical protein VCB59_01145 [Gammaproteobacteria bacterium]